MRQEEPFQMELGDQLTFQMPDGKRWKVDLQADLLANDDVQGALAFAQLLLLRDNVERLGQLAGAVQQLAQVLGQAAAAPRASGAPTQQVDEILDHVMERLRGAGVPMPPGTEQAARRAAGQAAAGVRVEKPE